MTPVASPLTDRFGRVHTDLRVSLTDRCSLRCDYCMPAEGLPWLSRDELLSTDELLRLVDLPDSGDKNFLALFTANKKDAAVNKQVTGLEDNWNAKARDHYGRAKALADQAAGLGR